MRVAWVSAKLIPARATSTTTSPSPGSGSGSSTSSITSGPPNSSIRIAFTDRSLSLCRAVSLTVVGSIAFDSVRTPFGERERMLGGSAVHFALAASFFTDVRVVGPVGDDFTDEHLALLADRGVEVDDIEHVAGGETFFWRGHYEHDMNVAHTDDTQLNVFADFEPKLSEESCAAADAVPRATSSPTSSGDVRRQSSAGFAALDSMNLWIDTARDSLVAAIGEVDCVLLNDAELRMLTGEPNLVTAARRRWRWARASSSPSAASTAPRCSPADEAFALPGLPLEDVRDPTGAGDSFAGGFLGYLDGVRGGGDARRAALRQAMAYGSVLASFNVEDFGTERVRRLGEDEIAERLAAFRRLTHFDEAPVTLGTRATLAARMNAANQP